MRQYNIHGYIHRMAEVRYSHMDISINISIDISMDIHIYGKFTYLWSDFVDANPVHTGCLSVSCVWAIMRCKQRLCWCTVICKMCLNCAKWNSYSFPNWNKMLSMFCLRKIAHIIATLRSHGCWAVFNPLLAQICQATESVNIYFATNSC